MKKGNTCDRDDYGFHGNKRYGSWKRVGVMNKGGYMDHRWVWVADELGIFKYIIDQKKKEEAQKGVSRWLVVSVALFFGSMLFAVLL